MSKHAGPDDEEMYSDGDEEYSDDGDQEESDADGDHDESDGDDEFSPQQSLPQLPAHLKLPIELELRVLDFFGSPWDDLWLNMRRVCTAWRDHIEARARNKWIHRAQLHFANPPDFALKLITTSSWKFQRLEEDGTAVFQDTDCAEEYKKRVIRECKRTGDPDIILGHYVFDIEIPGMTFDWPNLTARVHWRSLIVRMFAEEAAVKAAFQAGKRDMQRKAKAVMSGTTPGGFPDFEQLRGIFTAFADNLESGYRTVYRKRHGTLDLDECERLKSLRFEVGCDPIDSDEDEEEERRKAAPGGKTTKEAAMLLRAQYRMNPDLANRGY